MTRLLWACLLLFPLPAGARVMEIEWSAVLHITGLPEPLTAYATGVSGAVAYGPHLQSITFAGGLEGKATLPATDLWSGLRSNAASFARLTPATTRRTSRRARSPETSSAR